MKVTIKKLSMLLVSSLLMLLLIVRFGSLTAMEHSKELKDSRLLVELPAPMQQHMLSNMRDHLAVLNQILIYMTDDELEKAGELAEARLGMSSLELHGAKHMGQWMPKAMGLAGTNMHRAASRFAFKAEEGDAAEAYKALAKVTSTCVACHASFRIH